MLKENTDIYVEIGSHTVNHPLLVYEDDATVEHEVGESRKVLEGKVGKRIRAFAYPNGAWDEPVAIATIRNLESYEIERKPIGHRNTGVTASSNTSPKRGSSIQRTVPRCR